MENVKETSNQTLPFKRLRGGLLMVLGYLLSPVCWWNDLFFNLPIAYFFGYICSWFNRDLLLPGLIVGYWLSNVAGILLIQVGAVDIFQGQRQQHNWKKELLVGLAISTGFTLVIVALVQFGVIDAPVLSNN